MPRDTNTTPMDMSTMPMDTNTTPMGIMFVFRGKYFRALGSLSRVNVQVLK